MDETRKITVEVSSDLLDRALAYTGEGVTETVRTGLKKIDAERAQHEFRQLRGTHKFSISLDELRVDRPLRRKRK